MVGKSYQHWVISITDEKKLLELYSRTFGWEAGSTHTQLQDLYDLTMTDDDLYGTYTLDGIAKDMPKDLEEELAKCVEGYGNICGTDDEMNLKRVYFHGGRVFYPSERNNDGRISPLEFDSVRYGTDGYHRMCSILVPAKKIRSNYVVMDDYVNENLRRFYDEIKDEELIPVEIRRDWVFREMAKTYGMEDDSISYVLDRLGEDALDDLLTKAMADKEKSGITTIETYFPAIWNDTGISLCATMTDREEKEIGSPFPIRVMVSGSQDYYDSHVWAKGLEDLALRRLEAIADIKREDPEKAAHLFGDNQRKGIYYKVRKLERILASDKALLEELDGKDKDKDYLGSLPEKKAVKTRKKAHGR